MKQRLIYESDRLFSIYGYAMSHGLLLLRSGKSNEAPATRVDILFQDVRAMEVRAWFKGIRIEEVDDARFLNLQRSKPVAMIEHGHNVYLLTGSTSTEDIKRGAGWNGYIVGGIVQVNEDDGDLFGPSALVGEPVRPIWTLG